MSPGSSIPRSVKNSHRKLQKRSERETETPALDDRITYIRLGNSSTAAIAIPQRPHRMQFSTSFPSLRNSGFPPSKQRNKKYNEANTASITKK